MKEVTAKQRRRTARRMRLLRAYVRKVESLLIKLSKNHQDWKARNLK